MCEEDAREVCQPVFTVLRGIDISYGGGGEFALFEKDGSGDVHGERNNGVSDYSGQEI